LKRVQWHSEIDSEIGNSKAYGVIKTTYYLLYNGFASTKIMLYKNHSENES